MLTRCASIRKSASSRLRAGVTAFWDGFQQHLLVLAQVGGHALEMSTLFFLLLQAAQFADTQATVFFLPVVASEMPILRQTSAIVVPDSAWRKAKAICSSVNFDFS
ncbi:hypothetical protein LQR33_01265 [Chromobacterium piscinae]|nr:hypothetical protein [Chromobacterium piscinae]MCD5326420.1 hypothetical protein [Chromobacterium piscinae]